MQLCVLLHLIQEDRCRRNSIFSRCDRLPSLFHKREEICPVPSTATRVILPIYIKQDVSSRRWAAAGKPLPLGGKPLLISATEYLAGIGVSYLQIVNVGKILF